MLTASTSHVPIQELVLFFATQAGHTILKGISCVHGVLSLGIDYVELIASSNSQDLASALEIQPEEGLACLSVAAHQVTGGRAGGRAVLF
jgi:hypothetical protein